MNADHMTLEFLYSTGEPIRLIDLGTTFLNENHIESSNYSNPFRIAIHTKESRAGNAYYEYSQNGLPLPDGLNTFLKIEGAVIPFGKTRPSKNGYPTREGQTQVLMGNTMYKVTAYITEAKLPFYVKIVAYRKPDSSSNITKAQKAPKGGHII
jgi:hypothetical protein